MRTATSAAAAASFAVMRLIARGRGEGVDGLMTSLFSTLVFEPAYFVMERRMLLGIKALAEGRHISALGTRSA